MGRANHGCCRRGVRPAVGSIGRPGVGLGEVRRHFWRAIAQGRPRENAAALVGMSPAVGARWFRQNGGLPKVTLTPPSDRFLACAEREAIARLRAQLKPLGRMSRAGSRAGLRQRSASMLAPHRHGLVGARTATGRSRGAPSRLRTVCELIFLMPNRCASPTKRLIRRCTLRDAVP
jgi:hypothetical protein